MKYLFTILAVFFTISMNAQNNSKDDTIEETIKIKDVNFEKLLIQKGIDSGEPDGKVLRKNVEKVKKLEVSFHELEITDISGIEYFKNLEILRVEETNLTKLDVSKNTKLKILSIGGNERITELDLTKNIALEELHLYHHDAGSTGISFIDLTNNIKLTTLSFDSYMIDTIDLSNNINLTYLDASAPWIFKPNKGLKKLDLSNLTKLEHLDCDGNQLNELDLSNNIKLKHLSCQNNELSLLSLENNLSLEFVNCEENNLKYLDCVNNTKLESIWCSKALLKCLAVSPKTKVNYIEKNRVVTAKETSQTIDKNCLE